MPVNLGATLALRTTHCLRGGRHSETNSLNVEESTPPVFRISGCVQPHLRCHRTPQAQGGKRSSLERGVRDLAMGEDISPWLASSQHRASRRRVKRIAGLAASTRLPESRCQTPRYPGDHRARPRGPALPELRAPRSRTRSSGNPDNAADRTTGRTGEISRRATGQAPGETIEPVLPWGRSAKPRRALVVGPPNQAAGPASGKRGVNGGPTPREFPRGSLEDTRASGQIFGTARRIAFPSFTNTRYSTSRAWCRSSSSGTWRLRLATTASNESRVVSSLQRRFAST